VRELNEDSLAVLPEYGVVVLADGMGGYNAGEVASQLAVETITTHLMIALQTLSNSAPRAAINSANGAIFDAVAADPGLEGMATTAVVGLFLEQTLYYAHAGDSRLYRLRNAELTQLTRDHSMIQELVDQGMFGSLREAGEAGVKKNVLTRGLGIDPQLQVEAASDRLQPGDLYLFCSDGLSNMISNQQIRETLLQPVDDLELLATRLLEQSLQGGGLDNISLVLARPRMVRE